MSGHTTHTTPLMSPQEYTTTYKYNPVYGVQTTVSTDSRHTRIPLPQGQTLEKKLHWLKRNTGLTLPNHSNRDELENVTDLLLLFIDILGTENGEKGIFIKPVRIPTNGQSRSQRQHPIAQVLKADVNNQIDCMAAEGIIEICHNPKGFNSPVFAVRKKNDTIRVVVNFKRTLNKVLVDLDPYPTPRIDQLFHKIGEGNEYFATLDLHSGYW